MVLLGNREEFYSFTGKNEDDDAIEMAADYAEEIIMKIGNGGARVRLNSKDMLINTQAVLAKDSTGAGDAFNAGLAVALTEGQNIKDSLIFASATAGLSTTKIGTANSMPSREEIDRIL